MQMVLVLAAVAVGFLPGVLRGEDAPKRPAALQALDNFVGTWDIEVTVKPAGGQAVKQKGLSIRRWSRGRTYLLFDDPGETELHIAMRYDPESGTYPGVFIAGNVRGLLTGEWDKKSRTMTFTLKYANGNTYTGKHRFVGKDRAEASGAIKDAKGKVLLELSFKQKRRKAGQKR